MEIYSFLTYNRCNLLHNQNRHISDIRSLIGVRVGDHDISKERDCDYDEHGLEIQCAERYQDFGVESFYYHPDYTRTKLQNDIALIKLNSSIDFRPSNVKPICLPLGFAALMIPKKVRIFLVSLFFICKHIKLKSNRIQRFFAFW